MQTGLFHMPSDHHVDEFTYVRRVYALFWRYRER